MAMREYTTPLNTPPFDETANALAALIRRHGLSRIASHNILHFQTVTDVPENGLLVKGVLMDDDESIPLVDMRLRMKRPGRPGAETGSATVAVVELDETKLGVLMDEPGLV